MKRELEPPIQTDSESNAQVQFYKNEQNTVVSGCKLWYDAEIIDFFVAL